MLVEVILIHYLVLNKRGKMRVMAMPYGIAFDQHEATGSIFRTIYKKERG